MMEAEPLLELLPDKERQEIEDQKNRYEAFFQRRQKQAMEWFWGSPRGRAVAWAIFEITDLFRDTGFHNNSMVMARNLGRREFAQWLFDILVREHPDKLEVMFQENDLKPSAENDGGND